MYWSFSDVICHIHALSQGAYNGGGRRDASVRIIKNAPTTSKAGIWLLWMTFMNIFLS